MALITTKLPGLKLLSRGKVRDIYETSQSDKLLFVATDRISAYDVILNNGIPGKGNILTDLSLFWFNELQDVIPNHLITTEFRHEEMPNEIRPFKEVLEGRTMLVKKAEVVPIEAIVRGYLTGSAWVEYKDKGTIHGITVKAGMVESEKLSEPLFTPSTKAEQGAHDENIHPDKAAELIGQEKLDEIARVSVELYRRAASIAEERGVILADTKFEFGTIEDNQLILIDEVLTPDSSRYWPKSQYSPGRSQPSFDKQYLRDWLVKEGFKKGLEKGKDGAGGWTIPDEVVEGTMSRYNEVLKLLKRE
jgi:phosphoribosylaminoimidazole-succinocarboxamide synthase